MEAQSAWNQAGTWEDKTLNATKLQKIFDEHYGQSEVTNGINALLGCEQSVKVLAGEGSLITVRGKRKLGYELSAEITFKFKDGSEC